MPSLSRDTLREDVRAWMEGVLEARDWTPNAWAVRAGVAATTLTRFLAGSDYVPSSRTLAKLAASAGSAPSLRAGWSISQPFTVPLYASLGDAESGVRGTGSVQTMRDVSDQAYALTVSTFGLSMKGIFPGDVLILEPVGALAPRDGDVVAYYGEDGEDIGQMAGGFVQRFDGRAPLKLDGLILASVAVEVQRTLRAS